MASYSVLAIAWRYTLPNRPVPCALPRACDVNTDNARVVDTARHRVLVSQFEVGYYFLPCLLQCCRNTRVSLFEQDWIRFIQYLYHQRT